MIVDLPYPPSVNHYWLASGHRRYISPAGQRFRSDAGYLIQAARRGQKATNSRVEVSVSVEVYPPDRRRRDLDNILKPILDALQHSGVIEDDSQVAELRVNRCERVKGGAIRVKVTQLV